MAGLLGDFGLDPTAAQPGAPGQPGDLALNDMQRRLIQSSGLTQIGAALLAASQPQYGADRARYLAAIGNVPANMQEQALNMQQRKLLGLKMQAAQTQLDQSARMRAVLQSPQFQQQLAGLDPSTAALLKAAAAGGDMATVAKIYDSMQPKMAAYSGVVFDPRRGLVIDPLTGTRTSIYGNGAQTPASAPGNGVTMTPLPAPGATAKVPPSATPDDGRNYQFLASLPPQVQQMVKMYADGDMPPPTGAALRNPRIMQMLSWAKQFDPSFELSDYPARVALKKNMTSGPMQQTIASSNKFINHAKDLLDSYDTLGLGNGTSSWVTNAATLAKLRAQRDPRTNAVDTNAQYASEEFEKFMGGKGQMTDAARKLQQDLSTAKDPEQLYATVGKMVQMMHGQLTPIAENYQAVFKNPKYLPRNLLFPTAQASLDSINSRIAKMPNVLSAVYGTGPQPTVPGAAAPATPEAQEVQQDAKAEANGSAEGTIIINRKTGQRLVKQGGQWVPVK